MRALTAGLVARSLAVFRARRFDQQLHDQLQPEITAADSQGRTASAMAGDAMVSVAQLDARQVIADEVHNDLQAQITAAIQVFAARLDANAQNDETTAAAIRAEFAAADARVRTEFQQLLDAYRQHAETQLAALQAEMDEPEYIVGSVTSLPAGSAPSVTITGTERPYALNFGIPQGAAGQTGLTGATGPAGTNASGGISRIGFGVGRIAVALIIGQSVDVVVQLSRPMATTSYSVFVAPQAGWTFGTPKNRTATSVTIPVTAGLALAVGATFIVEAYE